MGRPPHDLTGHRFGRLTVLAYAGEKHWRCRCDCGQFTTPWATSLKNGTSQSCGCLQREQVATRRLTHGHTKPGQVTTEYHIWRGMKMRCLNPNHPSWNDYGGRGIAVCVLWRDSFEAFLKDMGYRPSPLHTLDRIDNSGNYEPGNCQWSLPLPQNANKRNNHRLTFKGKTQHINAWERELKLPYNLITQRLKRGWSVEDALTKPVNHVFHPEHRT